MRLLIDLQGMQNNSRDRGIGRYVTSLARGILRNHGSHDIKLLLSRSFPDFITPVIESLSDLARPDQFLLFDMPIPTAAMEIENAWRSAAACHLYRRLVDRLDADALLVGSFFEGGSDNSVSAVSDFSTRPVVASILYDLIPFLSPAEHLTSGRARAWYYNKIEEIRKTDLLLGISHSACKEAIDHLPSSLRQVEYVGAAAADAFCLEETRSIHAAQSADILAYHGITKPYIMHTSAFDPRKNFEGLIAAFAKLPPDLRASHQLVLVCKLSTAGRRRLLREISKAGLSDEDVITTGFVPDDELIALYTRCRLFVFPSFHEGFGLPVVEAMWCGAPVIGSNLSSVPEVVGRQDAQFDPYDQPQMIDLIARGLSDEEFREQLLAHAKTHSQTFSWDAVAVRALNAIEKVANQKSAKDDYVQSALAATIQRIAEIDTPYGPSDADLLSVAKCLDINEELRWSRV